MADIEMGCQTRDLLRWGNEFRANERTRAFSLRVIKLAESLPATRTSEVIGRQLLRSGTSVGANYRAAQRAKSRRDFIHKLGTVEEEADESAYWMEMLIEAKIVKSARLHQLLQECNEILAIVAASARTARKKLD
ncbi:MAG: four helix bundle protein [Phycisphaeraceae bacterium]|nr:four helix bundle protein [Phycisphaeraceae bacterium]